MLRDWRLGTLCYNRLLKTVLKPYQSAVSNIQEQTAGVEDPLGVRDRRSTVWTVRRSIAEPVIAGRDTGRPQFSHSIPRGLSANAWTDAIVTRETS